MEIIKITRYTVMYYITSVYVLVFLILENAWCFAYRESFLWPSGKSDEVEGDLKIHASLMLTGMVLIFATVIIDSSTTGYVTSLMGKISRFLNSVAVMAFSIAGLVVTFKIHKDIFPPAKHMYSLHSWLGLASVILMLIQTVCGLIILYIPKFESIRPTYFPIHICMGMIAFVGGATVALLGLTNRAFTAVPKLSGAGVGINFYGIAIIVLVGLVFYLVLQQKYKEDSFEMAVIH